MLSRNLSDKAPENGIHPAINALSREARQHIACLAWCVELAQEFTLFDGSFEQFSFNDNRALTPNRKDELTRALTESVHTFSTLKLKINEKPVGQNGEMHAWLSQLNDIAKSGLHLIDLLNKNLLQELVEGCKTLHSGAERGLKSKVQLESFLLRSKIAPRFMRGIHGIPETLFSSDLLLSASKAQQPRYQAPPVKLPAAQSRMTPPQENLSSSLDSESLGSGANDYPGKNITVPHSLERHLAQLDDLVGLRPVKRAVRSFANSLKAQQMREDNGLATIKRSLHQVFLGPPGTGKTTVARVMGSLLHSLGYLEKGHVVEVDRSGLVAQYVGQSEAKTQEAIKKALGGVLFIDEAYALAKESGNDFGSEVIATVLKAMEDHRSNLVVIVAGYADEMHRFINSNPGLQSRFTEFVNFPSYSEGELSDILLRNLKDHEFDVDPDFAALSSVMFAALRSKMGKHFGNARIARNVMESALDEYGNRIAPLSRLSRDDLKCLKLCDLPTEKYFAKEVDDLLALNPQWTVKRDGSEITLDAKHAGTIFLEQAVIRELDFEYPVLTANSRERILAALC